MSYLSTPPPSPKQLAFPQLRDVEEQQTLSHHSVSHLMEATSLRGVFKDIYYHLYSNSNLPRAERLAAEMVRLLFCKIYDELYNTELQFRLQGDESDGAIADRVRLLFESVRQEYNDA